MPTLCVQDGVLNTPKDVIENLEIEEIDVKIHGRLGSGGSKEVYDIELNGAHYALGICGIQDAPERVVEKWKIVLQEPQNTKFLRDQGFLVNEVCEIKPIKVSGTDFPGLLMKRFQDHDFRIFDSKNIGRNDNPIVNKETKLDDGEMLKTMSPG